MLKNKTLLLIITILYFAMSLVLVFSAMISGTHGDIVNTVINTGCSITWLIGFAIWFDLYLKCEKCYEH